MDDVVNVPWQPMPTGPVVAPADWVRHRSRQLGLSQTELAERAGMTRAYLHRLCAGGVPNPGVLTLQRLAQALQLPTTALVRLWVAADDNGQPCARTQQARHVAPHDPRDALVLVADTTVPDHAVVQPGERFTKTWVVQNAGEVPWPARRLVRQDAVLVVAQRERNGQLTPLLNTHLSSLEQALDMPATPPGGVQELRVDFAAPLANGSVGSVWRVESLGGEPVYKSNGFLQVMVTVMGG
jgi:transcriptional regulator with XRE-family HTH domain